jgi:hypothetical protein
MSNPTVTYLRESIAAIERAIENLDGNGTPGEALTILRLVEQDVQLCQRRIRRMIGQRVDGITRQECLDLFDLTDPVEVELMPWFTGIGFAGLGVAEAEIVQTVGHKARAAIQRLVARGALSRTRPGKRIWLKLASN